MRKRLLRSRRGMILILALLVIFVIETILTSMLIIAVAGSRRELSRMEQFSSREIAGAGLYIALNNLRQATDGIDNDADGEIDEGIDFDNDLLDPQVVSLLEGNLGRLGSLGWSSGSDVNGNGYPDLDEPGTSPVPFAGGEFVTWSVFSQQDGFDNDWDGVVDEGDEAGCVTLFSQARYGRHRFTVFCSGRFQEVFAPPNSPRWSPHGAMISGGDLTVTGNAEFLGTCANLHANQYLAVQGSTIVQGDATASGGMALSGAAQVSGTTAGDRPKAMIPDVQPEALRGEADYVLHADGRVVDAFGNLLGNLGGGGSFYGWTRTADGWQFSGTGVDPVSCAGTFFLEGNVHIAGTGAGGTVGGSGGGTQTFTMTVVATGNIQMAGNTRLEHSHPSGLLFVSGGDIRLTGTPQLDQHLGGVIAAREQVFIAGTPDIWGAVAAQDKGDASALNDECRVPGTPVITYDGGLDTPLPALDPSRPWFVLDPRITAYEER